MLDAIKTALAKFLVTKDVCAWLIKTALNAALKKAKDAEKRKAVCAVLTSGSTLMTTASKACEDGNVDDLEAESIEGMGIVFGEDIFKLIKG